MINVEEVKTVIDSCFEQIEGIKECIAELTPEAKAIANQRLKTVTNRLKMEMLQVSQTADASIECFDEELSLLGQVIHNLQLIIGNKKLEGVHKGFFITALSNMMEEFMSDKDWAKELLNAQKVGGYEMGYLQLESFKKWSTAAVTDLGQHGILVMHALGRNEWQIHSIGENSLRETIGMYGFDQVENDEYVEIFKSLIKEGLEGHINLVDDWSLGKMTEEDTEYRIQERLAEIDEDLISIQNFVNNFPQTLPRDTLSRLKRLAYRLELELYSFASLDTGSGGHFEGGNSLVDQLVENTRFVLDEVDVSNEEKVSLVATFSNIMLEFIDSAKFAEKLVNFQKIGDDVIQGYFKFDSIINWCNSRGIGTGNYGLMMTYKPTINEWAMHSLLAEVVIQNTVDSYDMSKINNEIVLDKVKTFIINGLERKKRTVKRLLKEQKLMK